MPGCEIVNLCESRIAVCLRGLTLNVGAQVARSTSPTKEKSYPVDNIHLPCKGERETGTIENRSKSPPTTQDSTRCYLLIYLVYPFEPESENSSL